jgi:hypothetical protein
VEREPQRDASDHYGKASAYVRLRRGQDGERGELTHCGSVAVIVCDVPEGMRIASTGVSKRAGQTPADTAAATPADLMHHKLLTIRG